MNKAIRARLQLDIDELLDNPYPGIRVFPPNTNSTEFCLVFTLSEGPWRRLNLHFKVSFDGRWPAAPPNVQSTSGLSHPMLVDSHIAWRFLGPEHLPLPYKSLYAIPLRILFIQLFKRLSEYWPTQLAAGGSESGAILDESTDTNFVHEVDPIDRSQADNDGQKTPHRGSQFNLGVIAQPERVSTDEEPIQRISASWRKSYQSLSSFLCPSCPYGSESLPHADCGFRSRSDTDLGHEIVTTSNESCDKTRACHLELLNDDVLEVIALYTPTESLRHFAALYPRMDWIVTSTRLIPRRELACVFLRRPVRDATLGIGITMRFSTNTVVSSNFEWISAEAVENHSAGSVYFLPLAFEPGHFKRAEEHIWTSIGTINSAILSMYRDRKGGKGLKPKDRRWMGWASEQLEIRKTAGTSGEHSPRSQCSISVLFWMMESVVESLFQACDKDFEHASRRPKSLDRFVLRTASHIDAAIISYGLIFHLLLCLCRSEPELLRRVVAESVRRFGNDLSSEETLLGCGFLDEFLILMMILDVLPSIHTETHVNLPSIIDRYLEVVTRNTNSTLEHTPPTSRAELGKRASGMQIPVDHCPVNSRKVMFHAWFLRTFKQFYSGEVGLSRLDSDFGFLEGEAITLMAQRVEKIHQVGTLPRFFGDVDLQREVAVFMT